MAIPKMSSQELNDVLQNAKDKITEVEGNVNNIKTDVQQKLMIMKHETEYVNTMFTKLQNGHYTQNADMQVLNKVVGSRFDEYGSVVHPMFIKEPTNVFNLKVGGTGEVFFRNDIKVSVDGVTLDRYTDVLKHESLPRKIFFDEYTSPEVRITIETEEASKLLGPTKFNMIELDSFLNGSYNIKKLYVYKLTANGEMDDMPDAYTYPLMGKSRILLPAKVNFYKVEIIVELTYSTIKNDQRVYPFGLKHLYFYDADFRTDSYSVVTIQKDTTIAIIKDTVKIKDSAGTRVSTIDEEGIEIYLDNIGGVLETQVYASTSTIRNEIARSVTRLYAKVPLNNRALIGVAFDVETR